MDDIYKWCGGAVMTVTSWLIMIVGGWDAPLTIMFTLMALDMLTGIIISFDGGSGKSESGAFSARVMFGGLTKKLMILIVVVLANSLDGLLGTVVARSAVIGFYSLNEGMSIIENAAIIGVPFPAGMLKALQGMRDKYNDDDPFHIFDEEPPEAKPWIKNIDQSQSGE